MTCRRALCKARQPFVTLIWPVQTFYPWASLTTRLWRGAEHIEVEWTVGPIPFKDGLGREVVVCPHSSNSCNAFIAEAM